jgi:hypothetical protein
MNPRFTPTNVGKNALSNSKEMVMARRSGGPFKVNVPEGNNAGARTVQRSVEARMNGVGRQQVPAELNATDRDHQKRMERKQAAAQAKQQG